MNFILGTLIRSQLPFYAEEASYVTVNKKLTLAKLKLRAFEITESQLEKFRIVIVTIDGNKFWAPKLEYTRNMDQLKLVFTAEPILIKYPIVLTKACLVDDENNLIKEENFSPYRNVNDGDRLDLSYDLQFHL